EVLQEQKGRFTGADGKVLLYFRSFLAAEGGIGNHDVVAMFLLNVGKVLSEGVGMDDVGRLNAVEDHVHYPDDVGKGLLFLSVEGALLKEAVLGDSAFGIGPFEVFECLTQESCGTDGTVGDGFAKLRFHYLNDGADERARGVIL